MTVLFLDDCPMRRREFLRECPTWPELRETAAMAIRSMKVAIRYDRVFLDYDGCGGMEVTDWIVANKPKIGRVVIHSANCKAALEMQAKLEAAGYDVAQATFDDFETVRRHL